MALQNIGASNKDDPFYRYKMPRMLTKIEGRGNGIKTNIVNMVDIAKALARPASYTTKYFGCELGAQSKFDVKTGVSIVNGAHDATKLASLLENFIRKYVQCANCRNPETEVLISKKQMISLKCAACGFLSDIDMRDKLANFILKNPPEEKKGGRDKKAMRRAEKERLKEGEAADEELKKVKKDAKKKGGSSKETTAKGVATKEKTAGGSSDEERRSSSTHSEDADFAASADDDDDVEWQTDTSAEAARKRMQEQLSTATAEMVMLSTEEEKTTPYDELVEEIKANLSNAATAADLKVVLSSSALPAKDVMGALFAALFHGAGKGFAKDVQKKKKYLAAAVPDEAAQMLLLRTIGAFCGTCSAEALKEVPVVSSTSMMGMSSRKNPSCSGTMGLFLPASTPRLWTMPGGLWSGSRVPNLTRSEVAVLCARVVLRFLSTVYCLFIWISLGLLGVSNVYIIVFKCLILSVVSVFTQLKT